MKTLLLPALVPLLLLSATGASAAEPAPKDVLAAVDRILAPESYTAEVEMVAHRPDGTNRVYEYRVYKEGFDKLLLTFDAPSVLSGHSALRRGDDMWRYIPSLKRAMRISGRSDFEGGDFRNADVLRVNLVRDYAVKSMKREGDAFVLELEATTGEAAYDKAKLWARAADFMPLRQEFYASSGKLLRTLECLEPKDFGGHLAPSVMKMKNEVAKGRYTVMTVRSMKSDEKIPASRFRVETMGR